LSKLVSAKIGKFSVNTYVPKEFTGNNLHTTKSPQTELQGFQFNKVGRSKFYHRPLLLSCMLT